MFDLYFIFIFFLVFYFALCLERQSLSIACCVITVKDLTFYHSKKKNKNKKQKLSVLLGSRATVWVYVYRHIICTARKKSLWVWVERAQQHFLFLVVLSTEGILLYIILPLYYHVLQTLYILICLYGLINANSTTLKLCTGNFWDAIKNVNYCRTHCGSD